MPDSWDATTLIAKNLKSTKLTAYRHVEININPRASARSLNRVPAALDCDSREISSAPHTTRVPPTIWFRDKTSPRRIRASMNEITGVSWKIGITEEASLMRRAFRNGASAKRYRHPLKASSVGCMAPTVNASVWSISATGRTNTPTSAAKMTIAPTPTPTMARLTRYLWKWFDAAQIAGAISVVIK